MVTTVIGNLFPPLSSLAAAPIMAHSLGVQGRGDVAAAMAPYLLLTTVAALGIPEAVTFYAARDPAFALATTRRALALVSAFGLVAAMGVLALVDWLGNGRATTRSLIIIAGLAMVPALCVGVFRGTASGLGRWRMVAHERLITSTIRLVAIAVLAALQLLTPLTATVALATAPILGGLAYARLPRLISDAHPHCLPQPGPSRLVSYGIRVWIGSVSGVLLMRVDQLLMTPLAGTYQLGLYVTAVAVSEVPLIVTAAVRDVSFASQATGASTSGLTQTARLSAAASALVGLGLIALAPSGIPWLFGAEFEPATSTAIILITTVILTAPGAVAGAGLSGRGRPGLRSTSLGIACIANLGLVLAMVPSHGALGAAYAMLAGSLISSILNVYFMKRMFGIPMHQFYGLRRSDLAATYHGLLKNLSATGNRER